MRRSVRLGAAAAVVAAVSMVGVPAAGAIPGPPSIAVVPPSPVVDDEGVTLVPGFVLISRGGEIIVFRTLPPSPI
jgi:hypothetical protein